MTARPLPVSSQCFVCGVDNRRGLKLRFFRRPESAADGNGGDSAEGVRSHLVSARVHLDDDLNGFADRTHGGVVAALLDEAMGWSTVLAAGRFTYTVELNVRYRLPVPTGQPLEVLGWVTRHTRRLSFGAAEIQDQQGQILASGDGKFMLTSELETRQIDDALIYDDDVERVFATE